MQVYWLEQTQADVPTDDSWLSASEALCLSRLRFPKRRADWRLGRWTAKRAIAAHLKEPAAHEHLADIEIRAASTGAPGAFITDRPAPLTISLSHRDGIAVCAIAQPGAALGCDLEIAEPRSPSFVADYFTSEEQAWLAQTPAVDPAEQLTLVWSAKESALKALQLGLRADTRSVIVSPMKLACTHEFHPLEVRCVDGRVFRGWWWRNGNLLRTLLAVPAAARPTYIRLTA